jgi:hypothetical protein
MKNQVKYDYNNIREYMRAHPDQEIKTAARNLGVPVKVVWRVFQVDARRENPNYASNTKTSEILKYLQAHPRHRRARLQEAIDCSPALITDTRALWADLMADPITAPHYTPDKRPVAKAPPPTAPKRGLAALNVEPVTEPKPEKDDLMAYFVEKQAEQFKELAYQATCGRQAQQEDASDVEAALDARAKQYGAFVRNADIAIKLKQVIHNAMVRENTQLYPDQLQALDMIATKISRILTGNPSHIDSWIDIAGYAKLVVDRLQGNAR